jgi:hypothetical protein
MLFLQRLSAVIGEFRRRFQLVVGRFDVLFCFCGVSAEFIFVFLLRFVGLAPGLLQMVLRFGKIGMPVRINILDGPLGIERACTKQSNTQQAV